MKTIPIATIAALTCVALTACSTTIHQMPIGRAKPVDDWSGIRNVSRDGSVYFAGQPTEEALRAAPDRGITTVINLRSQPEVASLEFDERAVVESMGMRYVSIPITSATFGTEQADNLHKQLRKTPGPVLLHCGSSNRVGALWALYLNRHRNTDADEAIEIGKQAGMRSEALMAAIENIAAEDKR